LFPVSVFIFFTTEFHTFLSYIHSSSRYLVPM
jgi:hypothetical protein